MKKQRYIQKITLFCLLMFFFLVLSLSFSITTQAASSIWIKQGNTSEKVVALTFDVGSDGTNFNRILDILAKHKIKATFFLSGQGAENHPSVVQKMGSHGHDIGNHSYSHPHFPQLTTVQMQSQLSRTEKIVKQITGRSTKPYFRAPYGEINAQILRAVGDAGYSYTFHWSIDTMDWQGHSASYVSNRVISNIHPGAIVLMHTGNGASGTPAALETIILNLKSKGYKFVTISQLMKRPSQPVPSTGTRHTVRAGDTLYAIARRYKTTVAKLAATNKITNINVIRVGQVLAIR